MYLAIPPENGGSDKLHRDRLPSPEGHPRARPDLFRLEFLLREVRQTVERIDRDRVGLRHAVNARTTRPSAGTATKLRDLVLAMEADSTFHRSSSKGVLEHEEWTGP